MTRFKFSAALALAAFITTPAVAQISEPAAAAARDPNFSIYARPGAASGFSAAARRRYDANAMAAMRMPVRPHRRHDDRRY